jgi:hypothetical protein
MREGLSGNDRKYLERLGKGDVLFTHAIDINGRATKLVRSTVSQSLQKHYHRLALEGLCAERVHGCGGHGSPPETTVTYSLTAMGREALGLHREEPPTRNRWTPPSDAELAREGIE